MCRGVPPPVVHLVPWVEARTPTSPAVGSYKLPCSSLSRPPFHIQRSGLLSCRVQGPHVVHSLPPVGRRTVQYEDEVEGTPRPWTLPSLSTLDSTHPKIGCRSPLTHHSTRPGFLTAFSTGGYPVRGVGTVDAQYGTPWFSETSARPAYTRNESKTVLRRVRREGKEGLWSFLSRPWFGRLFAGYRRGLYIRPSGRALGRL